MGTQIRNVNDKWCYEIQLNDSPRSKVIFWAASADKAIDIWMADFASPEKMKEKLKEYRRVEVTSIQAMDKELDDLSTKKIVIRKYK